MVVQKAEVASPCLISPAIFAIEKLKDLVSMLPTLVYFFGDLCCLGVDHITMYTDHGIVAIGMRPICQQLFLR